ncbi:TVP38/TMEM64 family protein [Blautia argi]|mgnify:CR=1 FL=1|uniref:TVP38/TMEM64 family membrane protein n=1 Tax=Blautia argi TaxID=1912897 RepID=A0A2Z4UAX8_9FIRM|nr:TVP38/TMEM64 family protein [Blautia argi]AWY98157.1 TVP38/TMEM64 family protein [Blautia argi]
MERQKTTVYLNLCTLLGLAGMACFIWYGVQNQIFVSAESLKHFLNQFGLFAPALFLVIQMIQVVLPILPGAVGCLGGVLIFGPVWGFVYNYIGISLGSILAFLLSKRYGRPFVRGIIGEKNYEKYIGWLEKGKAFDKAFAVAIFLPVAPDDLLCYMAGLTPMSLKKFATIIFLGKPGSIFLYSLGLTGIMEVLKQIF